MPGQAEVVAHRPVLEDAAVVREAEGDGYARTSRRALTAHGGVAEAIVFNAFPTKAAAHLIALGEDARCLRPMLEAALLDPAP